MRKRSAGDASPPPPTRGPEGTRLYALLSARAFRLGAGTERIQRNLAQHGGEHANDASAIVTSARPPVEAPSISLGEHPGTLGPHSFGFVNNVGGVAPLDAPLPSLPRKGGLALIVPRRDALPDVGPLALARNLGLSWIISVGDGDPAEALAFVGADTATAAIAVVLGDGADGATLRQVLGVKPTVLWGGDALCRAVARRAGALVVDGIDELLARAQLYDAGVEPGARASVIVVGGGRAYVQREVEAAGLDAEVHGVDERDRDTLVSTVEAARTDGRPVVLVAGGPPPLGELAPKDDAPLLLVGVDLRHPEHLRALLRELAAPAVDSADKQPRPRVDKDLLERVRSEVDRELADHDCKRLLKAYGVRVSRQAPTNTPTGAIKIARTIGLPVTLAAPPGTLADAERVARTQPDVRRLAALLLQELAEASSSLESGPYVMVREHFPEVPRVRVRVQHEKGLGLVMQAPDAMALLPLTRADALAVAAATPARRSADQKALAELLERVSHCATSEDALLDLELHLGAEPVVVTASGTLRRPGA